MGAPCQCFHPRFLVACTLPAHPHKVSHHAAGKHDGIHWTLFWWEQAAQHERAEEPADVPVGIPVQQMPMRAGDFLLVT